MKLLVNHLGYCSKGSKKAVIQYNGNEEVVYALLDKNRNVIMNGQAVKIGEVARWDMGDYWIADFSQVEEEGVYKLEASAGKEWCFSYEFEISRYFLSLRMLSSVGYYFKAQRSSGEWLECDRSIPFKGDKEGLLDVHGGWYDATGDYGIHLSHLSHSTYYNPQQVPFSAYAFFKVYEEIENSKNQEYSMVKRRMLDEGFFGADFLVRMWSPSGSFYRSINRGNALDAVMDSREIGFEYKNSSDQFSDKASTADEEVIQDENYEVSLRSGGGLSIAALAIAARYYYPSADYSQKTYITTAKRAFKHLEENNERYTNDGKWNLLDEYCALFASIELYKTTGEYDYLNKSRIYAGKINTRMVYIEEGKCRIETIPGMPFYHAADEGMPVIALLEYAKIETDAKLAKSSIQACENLMRWKIELTDAEANPFGYPKLEVAEGDRIKSQFFFPHNTTAAPWWQGENARLASIASAALLLSRHTEDEGIILRLRKMAQDQLDWIMGLNPFDSCMIEGYGNHNIQYFFNERYDFINCPAGIVNGITSAMNDEEGIEFIMEPTKEVCDNWRWAEQWIPHASWFMYAVSLNI